MSIKARMRAIHLLVFNFEMGVSMQQKTLESQSNSNKARQQRQNDMKRSNLNLITQNAAQSLLQLFGLSAVHKLLQFDDFLSVWAHFHK